jgi:hypothetical protein
VGEPMYIDDEEGQALDFAGNEAELLIKIGFDE